jgi:hypothetical protein
MGKPMESEHRIKSVGCGGEIVILDDDSVWTIAPHDRLHTMVWLSLTPIAVGDCQLINTEDGQAVAAERIRRRPGV